jgi:hypothetical protein
VTFPAPFNALNYFDFRSDAYFEPQIQDLLQNLDLVALSVGSDIRFLRTGTHPPLRGIYLKLSDPGTLLFTVGYVPEFRRYPGARVPKPMVFRHERGDSTRETICKEIMALTKLNWNSWAYASKVSITTLFAASVGVGHGGVSGHSRT